MSKKFEDLLQEMSEQERQQIDAIGDKEQPLTNPQETLRHQESWTPHPADELKQSDPNSHTSAEEAGQTLHDAGMEGPTGPKPEGFDAPTQEDITNEEPEATAGSFEDRLNDRTGPEISEPEQDNER